MEAIVCGDAVEYLKYLEPESFNTCITSPPYYNLRNYGTPGQIGMEDTPEEYVAKLTAVFREVRRVLRPDGTLWVNIGDSYASKSDSGRYKGKDLIGVPWMLAFALRRDGWYLRQDIVWNKSNCMPESVRDRCTKSHEFIFLLSKKPRYYFDAEAISEPIAGSSTKRYLQNLERQRGSDRQPGKTNGPMKAALPRFGGEKYGDRTEDEARTKSGKAYVPTMRRNRRDVWTVSTAGFKGSHFAVFPEKLIEPCVLAGCPEGGTVLDPFAGSGTTGVVAKRLHRNFLGIEINAEYVSMAADRIAATVVECPQEQLSIEAAQSADTTK